jgi:hypothetical protein
MELPSPKNDECEIVHFFSGLKKQFFKFEIRPTSAKAILFRHLKRRLFFVIFLEF